MSALARLRTRTHGTLARGCSPRMQTTTTGCGVTVTLSRGRHYKQVATVCRVVSATARAAGVQQFDEIVAINSKPIPPDLQLLRMELRSPEQSGRKVILSILRNGSTSPLLVAVAAQQSSTTSLPLTPGAWRRTLRTSKSLELTTTPISFPQSGSSDNCEDTWKEMASSLQNGDSSAAKEFVKVLQRLPVAEQISAATSWSTEAGDSLLHVLSMSGEVNGVKEVLSLGADIENTNNHKETGW